MAPLTTPARPPLSKTILKENLCMCLPSPSNKTHSVTRRSVLQFAVSAAIGALITEKKAEAAVDFDIDRFGDKELKVSTINRVKQNLRNALAEQPELLGPFVLLALHDGLTFNTETNEGGPNGSLRFEGDWSQNQELADAMQVMHEIRALQREQMSYADTCCFAGAVAVEITGGPRIRIQLGREDAKEKDPVGRSDGLAPEKSADDLMAAYQQSGLGAKEAVLFHGAFGSLSDIARTRLEKLKKQKELDAEDEDVEDEEEILDDKASLQYGRISGKRGKKGPVLVSSNVSALTLGGAKFSNDYLKFMLDAEKKKKDNLSERDKKMLAHREMRDNISKYANNNKQFISDFADAFEKVSLLGSRYESMKFVD